MYIYLGRTGRLEDILRFGYLGSCPVRDEQKFIRFQCGFVANDAHDRRVRGLNDRDLRSRFEIAYSLGFGAQRLNGGHYLRRLFVISLPQR